MDDDAVKISGSQLLNSSDSNIVSTPVLLHLQIRQKTNSACPPSLPVFLFSFYLAAVRYIHHPSSVHVKTISALPLTSSPNCST